MATVEADMLFFTGVFVVICRKQPDLIICQPGQDILWRNNCRGVAHMRGTEAGEDSHHHGSAPIVAWENVPVGPSEPSRARRTASAAPCSGVSVPANPVSLVLV